MLPFAATGACAAAAYQRGKCREERKAKRETRQRTRLGHSQIGRVPVSPKVEIGTIATRERGIVPFRSHGGLITPQIVQQTIDQVNNDWWSKSETARNYTDQVKPLRIVFA